ncbi:MAG: AzlD domain-containing protein [Clostridia bacterium]|nr:AzlD domain-containing protein [Clostridia bacterium]
MKNYLVLIIGMMLVTYIPRLVPLVTMSQKPIPPLVKKFLLYIPYTALGALIIPGALQATPGLPAAALVGVGATAVVSWFKGGLMLPVMSSIAATFLVLYSLGTR